MSGDGGWAGLDQDVAAALSAKGIPVVGLDSLRYYWTARTPDGLAADTDRIVRYYLAHFGKRRVLLIGYSQGADVLPFAVNRLPAATRARRRRQSRSPCPSCFFSLQLRPPRCIYAPFRD